MNEAPASRVEESAVRQRSPASFRDPRGYVYFEDGRPFRVVTAAGGRDYARLMSSGLYERLASEGRLVRHEERSVAGRPGIHTLLAPEKIPFISYPYEWCFSQLKDAAVLTLELQTIALEHGMSLRDASAFNVQFRGGRPVFIDTLSFGEYEEGRTWEAYRQFCQHFVAPLALMSCIDFELQPAGLAFIDGIPLRLASRLLPAWTWLSPRLLVHVHVHAHFQRRYESTAGGGAARPAGHLSRNGLLGIVRSLRNLIESLEPRHDGTPWEDYYSSHNYSPTAFAAKQEAVGRWLDAIQPRTVWDFGANTGEFSRLATARGASTVAMDIDPGAVEANYRQLRRKPDERLLPLRIDWCNPTPAAGWANEERSSLQQRGPADCGLALALVHHLAIANNVPLERIAGLFAGCCRELIIEFVPKDDPQVRRLLRAREDIFADYNEGEFERAFGLLFEKIQQVKLADSGRSLYHFKQRANQHLNNNGDSQLH